MGKLWKEKKLKYSCLVSSWKTQASPCVGLALESCSHRSRAGGAEVLEGAFGSSRHLWVEGHCSSVSPIHVAERRENRISFLLSL